MTSGLSDLLLVAREAILARLQKREPKTGIQPGGALARAAPVFVTLKIDGVLRGCMGVTVPCHGDLVGETADRACAAAFSDPRFPPLSADELTRASIEVTVLGLLQPVDSPADLDPARFGIEITDARGRRAVLLPAIEGIDTVECQLAVARRKAGMAPGASVSIRRFATQRVSEEDSNGIPG